jgi:hypothetical protein
MKFRSESVETSTAPALFCFHQGETCVSALFRSRYLSFALHKSAALNERRAYPRSPALNTPFLAVPSAWLRKIGARPIAASCERRLQHKDVSRRTSGVCQLT